MLLTLLMPQSAPPVAPVKAWLRVAEASGNEPICGALYTNQMKP